MRFVSGWSAFIYAVLIVMVAIPLHSQASFPQVPDLLPPSADYQRDKDCSEISPAPEFFSNGKQGPSSRSSNEPLRPPDGLRSPLKQGYADLCFAYASAEAITQRTGIVVAPLDISTTFYYGNAKALAAQNEVKLSALLKQSFPGVDLESKILHDRSEPDTSVNLAAKTPTQTLVDDPNGGDEVSAMLMANTKGLCPAKNLPSNEGFRSHMHALATMKAHAKKQCLTSSMRSTEGTVNSTENYSDVLAAEWIKYVEKSCQRVKSPVRLIPVEYGPTDDLKGWNALNPERKKEESGKLLSRIDYALNHGRMAIASMDWYILEKPDGHDGTHAAPIIGRKMVNGVCHYLMRDNVNEPCKDLYQKFQPRCNNGHIWLTESELSETMFNVVYLR